MPDPSQCPLFYCGWTALEDTLKRVKPGVVFDLGANEGGFFNLWLGSGAKVHAFEPVPNMVQKIRDQYGNHPDVTINQLAVSDANTEIKDMNVFRAWCLLPHATSEGKATEYANQPPFDMTATTLDTYVEKTGVVPQFVKVDVDGYELKVLKGGVNLFTKHRPPMLFEFSYLPRLVGDSIEEMCNLIYAYGYEAHSMRGNYKCPDAADMMRNFPEHNSYDIMLLPKQP